MNKTVLILGASGGIGRACADLFSAHGWSCAVHAYQHTNALQNWVDRHPGCLLLQGDLTIPSVATQMISRCNYHLGRIIMFLQRVLGCLGFFFKAKY